MSKSALRRDEVTVFKTSDPSSKPVVMKEVTLIARHNGIYNYNSFKRATTAAMSGAGPMHAFEQGKLILLPNTLPDIQSWKPYRDIFYLAGCNFKKCQTEKHKRGRERRI